MISSTSREKIDAYKTRKLKDVNKVYQRRRKTLTTQEKEKLNKNDKVQHQQKRKTLTTQEKEKLKTIDMKTHQEQRKALTTQEKEK